MERVSVGCGRRGRRGRLRLAELRERWRATDTVLDRDRTHTAVSAAARAVEALGALEWDAVDGEAAMVSVLELETARRRLGAAIAVGMARLEDSGETVEATGLVAHRWLAHSTQGSTAAARRDVKVGVVLGRFSGFAEALEHGSIAVEHVAALDAVCNPRILGGLQGIEDDLLHLAAVSSFEGYRRGLRVLAAALDVDGARPDCSEVDTAVMSITGGGELHLRARFSGHNAVVAERALRDELERQWRAAGRDHTDTGAAVPTVGVLRARALGELIRRGILTDPATATAARSEAIIEIRADSDGTLLPPHSIDGEPLDAVTAAVLACDVWLHPIITDLDHTPLFAGRAQRYFTIAQRRALIIRDGGCVFPGCDAPASWCDAHHVIPWEHHGRTDIDNAALLCRRHHGLAHSKHWTLQAIPAHLEHPHTRPAGAIKLVWHTPDGRTIDAQSATTRRTHHNQHRTRNPAA